MHGGANIILKGFETFKHNKEICIIASDVLLRFMEGNIEGAKQFSRCGITKSLVSVLSANKSDPECCKSIIAPLCYAISVDSTNENSKRALDAGALDILMNIAVNGTDDIQIGKACSTISELLHTKGIGRVFAKKGFVPPIIEVYRKRSGNKYIAGYFSEIMSSLALEPDLHRVLRENDAVQILDEILRNYKTNRHVAKPATEALKRLAGRY